MGRKRIVSLIAGVLALAAGLGVNLSEQGLFALQPPFDSGLRVAAVEADELRLRTDAERIDAALELLVEAPEPALEASLVEGAREVAPLGVEVAREGPHQRVRVFAAGGRGVSAKFAWPPGVALALRAPPGRGAPQLRGWVLYSDQHPTDSAERVRARRHARRWLLGLLMAGFVGGVALLVSGLKRDGEGDPPVDLKVQIVERILQTLELQAAPRTAALGRSILRSVLLEDMTPEDAIRRHAPSEKLGRAAFLWGRQVFLHTVTQMTTDLGAKYLARLRGAPARGGRR